MILNLQILRAVAAVLVIFAHLKFVLPVVADELPVAIRGAGLACGVDLFFVLSGFVITHTARKADLGWKQFLTNRIIRVMPLFWLTMLPFLIPAVTQGMAQGDVPYRTVWNSLFLVPVLDKLGINDPAHPFGWTLSFEMWFYVLFSILLVVIPAKRVPVALIGIFLVTAPLPFLWHLNWKFPYFAFHPLCWEFAMGCGAYEITRRFRANPWFGLLVLVAGIALLGWSAMSFEHLGWHGRIRMEPVLSAQRAIFWGVPAFLIVMACVWTEPFVGKGGLVRFLVFLGGASYAIYLMQPVVFQILPWILGPLAGRPWYVSGAVTVTLCCLSGCAIHVWVERPLARWLRSLMVQPQTVAEAA